MSRGNISKNKATKLHACRRAAERYGVSPEVVDEVTRIVKRESKRVARYRAGHIHTSCGADDLVRAWRIHNTVRGREVWRVVPGEGREYRVVYDVATRRVVTFLPLQDKVQA